MLKPAPAGLYCEAGDFHVDPWQRLPRAVVTHAHADHARWGCGSYLCSAKGEMVLRARVGSEARIESLPYGEPLSLGGIRVSLHPAGHIRGSAQVRLEHRGEVWVVSGDSKIHLRQCGIGRFGGFRGYGIDAGCWHYTLAGPKLVRQADAGA